MERIIYRLFSLWYFLTVDRTDRVHITANWAIKSYKIQFSDKPLIQKENLAYLEEFVSKKEDLRDIKNIIALRKVGPRGTREDGEEIMLWETFEGKFKYYSYFRQDIHSCENHVMLCTNETADTLDELFHRLYIKQIECYLNPPPCASKISLQLFTRHDLALYIASVFNKPDSYSWMMDEAHVKRHKPIQLLLVLNKKSHPFVLKTRSFPTLHSQICKIFNIGYKRSRSTILLDDQGDQISNFEQLKDGMYVYVTPPSEPQR